MKKKIIMLVILLISVLSFVTSCGSNDNNNTNNNEHIHNYSLEWNNDENNHWKVCDCGEKTEVGTHTYGDFITIEDSTEDSVGSKKQVCSVCGYENIVEIPVKEHTHNYSNEWSYDDEKHWNECLCGKKSNVEVHNYVDGFCSICGCSYTSKGFIYALCNDDTYSVIGIGNCTDTDIIIPSSHNYKKVTSIGSKAFSGCSSLKSITIPSSVTSIEYNSFSECSAFSGCINLTSVSFEDNSQLTKISNSAFENCSSLTDIVIPEGVTSIGNNAFSGCSSLTSIVIPSSVTSIGLSVLSGCSSLESITIPFVGKRSDVTSSDKYQYPFGYIFGTSSYTGGVETKQYYFESSTFSTSYTTYYIPSTLKSVTVLCGNILYGAFYNCSNIETIVLSGNITSIGSNAFYECSNLASVSFGDNSQLTKISNSSFKSCSSLTSITIPSSVTNIEEYAFSECSSLTSIEIPSSVTSIGEHAFQSCSSLISVSFEDCCQLTEISYSTFKNCSSLTDIVIPSSVISIDREVFDRCSSLTSITIPSSVTSIGNYTFSECSSLTSIEIPSSVTSIGGHAFQSCSSLTSVLFEDCCQLTEISYSTFENCSSLTDIVIPSSVISIGEAAFKGCGLKNIEIPANVIEINKNVFLECNSLTSITLQFIGEKPEEACNDYLGYLFGGKSYSDNGEYIPDSLEKVIIGGAFINEYSFYECNGLKNITILDGVTSIEKSAFNNCSSLESITIPNSVTSIGETAFSKCSSLKSITIPNSVTSIGETAFNNCSSLTSVIFEDDCQLSIIKKSVFENCNKLNDFIIPSSITSIEEYAFSGCTALEGIIIPDTVKQIASFSFDCELKWVVIGKGIKEIPVGTFGLLETPYRVYFNGDETDWSKIEKNLFEWYEKTIYYYLPSEPIYENTINSYWHYVDGIPIVW